MRSGTANCITACCHCPHSLSADIKYSRLSLLCKLKLNFQLLAAVYPGRLPSSYLSNSTGAISLTYSPICELPDCWSLPSLSFRALRSRHSLFLWFETLHKLSTAAMYAFSLKGSASGIKRQSTECIAILVHFVVIWILIVLFFCPLLGSLMRGDALFSPWSINRIEQVSYLHYIYHSTSFTCTHTSIANYDLFFSVDLGGSLGSAGSAYSPDPTMSGYLMDGGSQFRPPGKANSLFYKIINNSCFPLYKCRNARRRHGNGPHGQHGLLLYQPQPALSALANAASWSSSCSHDDGSPNGPPWSTTRFIWQFWSAHYGHSRQLGSNY